MRLFGARLLVRPIPADNTSPGGIQLPESNTPSYRRSRVVQLGEGSSDGPKLLGLKAGDVVLHLSPGREITFGGDTLMLLHEGDLFGVE